MIQGYLPTSNGPRTLDAALSAGDSQRSPNPHHQAHFPSTTSASSSSSSSPFVSHSSSPYSAPPSTVSWDEPVVVGPVAKFYKAWDQWGALGNFSPHAIVMDGYDCSASTSADDDGGGGGGGSAPSAGPVKELYRSVEHYYQASKFSKETEEGRILARQVGGGGGKRL